MSKLSLFGTICLICVFCTLEGIGLSAQTFKVLVDFNDTDGAYPTSPLVQGLDGNFYGTTAVGGANFDGTIFKVTPSGTLTTIYNSCSQSGCADGGEPAALVQATDGNFYGTNAIGGGGEGTVFKITPQGALTTLYTFTNGGSPHAGLVQATDGNFYGTTVSGNGFGTVFKISPQGALITLYSFCSQTGCLTAPTLTRDWFWAKTVISTGQHQPVAPTARAGTKAVVPSSESRRRVCLPRFTALIRLTAHSLSRG